MKPLSIVVLALTVLVSAYCATAQSTPVRIGIIGDSITDEYQSPGEAWDGARNWLEHLVLSNWVDAGAWGSYGEPRRTGYTQNWARYGATTETAISAGQHTGLAAQGVDFVVVWIGSNDYAPYSGASSAYGLIYHNTLNDAQVTAKEAQILSRITTLVTTVKGANTRMVLVTINDWGNSPSVVAQFPVASQRKRVTDSVNRVNAQLTALATSQGIGLFDVAAFYADLPIDTQNGTLTISGYTVNLFQACNAPNCGLVGDGIHTNSIPSGLLANGVLAAYNAVYAPDVPLLSDAEILVNAGVLSATATPSPTATFMPEPTYTATPTPTLTPSETFTPIPIDTPTSTFTSIPTDTPTSIPSATETPIPTDTAIPTPTATETQETPTLAPDELWYSASLDTPLVIPFSDFGAPPITVSGLPLAGTLTIYPTAFVYAAHEAGTEQFMVVAGTAVVTVYIMTS